MRFSIGVGLGPVRATQRIGLPRSRGGGGSRHGYFEQFEECTVKHRTLDTEDRCPRRHPNGIAAQAPPSTTGEKWAMFAMLYGGLWFWVIVLGALVGGLGGVASALTLGFIGGSPFLLIFLIWAARVPSSGQPPIGGAAPQRKVQPVLTTEPQPHDYVPTTDTWNHDSYGVPVCGVCSRRKQSPVHTHTRQVRA